MISQNAQFLHQLYRKYNDQFIIKNPGKKSSYLKRKESLFMCTLAHLERLVHKFKDRDDHKRAFYCLEEQ